MSELQINYLYRICYTRLQEMAYISHLDLVGVLKRTILRANLPVAYTQGFHSMPKLGFSAPVSLGVESEAEYLDLYLQEEKSIELIEELLNSNVPSGIVVKSVTYITEKVPSLDSCFTGAVYQVNIEGEFSSENEIQNSIQTFLDCSEISLKKLRKIKGVKRFAFYNARPHLLGMKFLGVDKGVLSIEVSLSLGTEGSTKVGNLMEFFVDYSQLRDKTVRIRYKKIKMLEN